VRISRALRHNGVVPDFRPPNVIRLAPVALYTSYLDVWRTATIIRDLVADAAHLRLDPQPMAVG
jgi:kynureninase